MTNNRQAIKKRKNKKKALTLDIFYIQNRTQSRQERRLKKQTPNLPKKMKIEIMRKMEEIWKEKWEIAQKEINHLKDKRPIGERCKKIKRNDKQIGASN